MKKYLLIILLLPINCLATSETYILNSICELQKTVYVPIGNDDKKPKATFEVDNKPTGETYTLTINRKGRINIEYKSKEYPFINWDLLSELKRDNVRFNILNEKNIIWYLC